MCLKLLNKVKMANLSYITYRAGKNAFSHIKILPRGLLTFRRPLGNPVTCGPALNLYATAYIFSAYGSDSAFDTPSCDIFVPFKAYKEMGALMLHLHIRHVVFRRVGGT